MSKMKEKLEPQQEIPTDIPDNSDHNYPWQFSGSIDCEWCKFNAKCAWPETNCPYLIGWKEGQDKLIKWLEEPCHHYLSNHMPLRKRRSCNICCKQLGESNG